jgi:hypothetical protein
VLPPEADATINDLAFWDRDHGIAVSGWTGSPPPGVNPEIPLILMYRHGTWERVPVATLPAGFVRVTLGAVRMTGPNEAWAIGSGFDLIHAINNRPVIMRIRLPAETSAPAAMESFAATGAESSALAVTRFASADTAAGIHFDVEASRPAAGTLTVYTPGMLRIRSFALDGASAGHAVAWDGTDGSGLDAGWGWFQAIVEFPDGGAVVREQRWVLRPPPRGRGRSLVGIPREH